jgi:hypothetical protein
MLEEKFPEKHIVLFECSLKMRTMKPDVKKSICTRGATTVKSNIFSIGMEGICRNVPGNRL